MESPRFDWIKRISKHVFFVNKKNPRPDEPPERGFFQVGVRCGSASGTRNHVADEGQARRLLGGNRLHDAHLRRHRLHEILELKPLGRATLIGVGGDLDPTRLGDSLADTRVEVEDLVAEGKGPSHGRCHRIDQFRVLGTEPGRGGAGEQLRSCRSTDETRGRGGRSGNGARQIHGIHRGQTFIRRTTRIDIGHHACRERGRTARLIAFDGGGVGAGVIVVVGIAHLLRSCVKGCSHANGFSDMSGPIWLTCRT